MTEESSTNTKSETDPQDTDLDAQQAEASVGDASAKKKSLIIRGVVIAGLLYFGVTEFILKEDPPPLPQVVARKIPKKVVKVPEEKKAEEQKPIDAKADLEKTAVPSGAAQEIAKKDEPLQVPVEEVNIAKKQEEIISPAAGAHETVAPIAEKEVDKKIDQLIENIEKPEPLKESRASARSGERQETKHQEVNLAEKIVADDKYVEPPSFEFLGRGLVYNCKEKFWACLNKLSYIQCNKNMKWNNANNKATECAVVSVYKTNDDCETVQKYNVSTSQSTSFCKQ